MVHACRQIPIPSRPDSNPYAHSNGYCCGYRDADSNAYTCTQGYTNRSAASDPTPAAVGSQR